VWRRVDDVFRFVYVLLAPVMIVALGKVVPVGGILISTGIATVIAMTGSTRWITMVATIRFLGKPLAKFGKLGEYYRVHTPAPLVYYVLYPLLFPYWLFKRTARQEFFAYKRVGALAVIITVVSAVHDYFHNWAPIPSNFFFGMMLGTAVLQLLITFMFVMPIVTTLIGYQKRGHKKSMVALVVVSLGMGVLMAYGMRKLEMVPLAVQARLHARIKWQPEAAHAVIRDALENGVAHAGPGGAPLEAARETLATVFRPDEARAFMIYNAKGVVILVAKVKSHKYAWAARNRAGPIVKAVDLPTEMLTALELEPTASVWP